MRVRVAHTKVMIIGVTNRSLAQETWELFLWATLILFWNIWLLIVFFSTSTTHFNFLEYFFGYMANFTKNVINKLDSDLDNWVIIKIKHLKQIGVELFFWYIRFNLSEEKLEPKHPFFIKIFYVLVFFPSFARSTNVSASTHFLMAMPINFFLLFNCPYQLVITRRFISLF